MISVIHSLGHFEKQEVPHLTHSGALQNKCLLSNVKCIKGSPLRCSQVSPSINSDITTIQHQAWKYWGAKSPDGINNTLKLFGICYRTLNFRPRIVLILVTSIYRNETLGGTDITTATNGLDLNIVCK